MTTNIADVQYLERLNLLIDAGEYRMGRNGGTFGLFGTHMRFDLSEGFPLLTTKKIHVKSMIVELLWFLRGETNVKFLHDHGVTIWDEWADERGEVGPVYGKQWRSWPAPILEPNDRYRPAFIDQVYEVLRSLRHDPYSRRHIVSAWNAAQIDEMALPPCHVMFQFHVNGDGELSCHMYQRSADWFLGVPFNIASYALLTMLVARELNRPVRDLVISFGDWHLYANHMKQASEQVTRAPRALPQMLVRNGPGIFDLQPGDFELIGYDPHPAIRAEVSK